MKNLALTVLMFVVVGVAGRMDYTEEVIYNMPNSVYRAMKSELAGKSDAAIADEYQANKAYWEAKGEEWTLKYGEE